ncbi:MAG: hypothetical protein Q8L55_16170 [Phycisphaerales bacterium]|nr:hypothetical protein [Phycisphaerales bacterium]
MSTPKVVFLNARTCGIYKNGGQRFKTDARTGQRTDELDDELNELVDIYRAGRKHPGITSATRSEISARRVLVPTYYDHRYEEKFEELIGELGWEETTIGDLVDAGVITVRGGHGSPGNDQRAGTIPYIKVSDIRGLRVNTNPTNLVSDSIARKFWRGEVSGLHPFDIVTPNRASSNIGEFAVLLPGEEQVVFTKEVFILRVGENATPWDPFTLLWALSLAAVRVQWKRIALMQTNREDCGTRYREVRLPLPPSAAAGRAASQAFREYFTTLAGAKQTFLNEMRKTPDRYIASVFSSAITAIDSPDEGDEPDGD